MIPLLISLEQLINAKGIVFTHLHHRVPVHVITSFMWFHTNKMLTNSRPRDNKALVLNALLGGQDLAVSLLLGQGGRLVSTLSWSIGITCQSVGLTWPPLKL